MKPLRWIVYLALLIALPTVSAESDYQFHTVTAQEYIAGFPRAVIMSEQPSNYYQPDGDVAGIGEYEFVLRFWETENFATVSDFYDLLTYGFDTYGSFMPFADYLGWNLRLVERRLAEHPLDFAHTTAIIFDRYTINVSAVDFNGNGSPEWLLHVQRRGSNYFDHYWSAIPDTTSPTGYHIEPLPIPYQGYGFWAAQEEWSGAYLSQMRDLTGDGLPEVIFGSGGALPSSGIVASYGTAYILGWRETGFARLAHLSSTSLGYTFENLDDDAALEIVMREDERDNWQCEHGITTIYDWDGTTYTRADPVAWWAETGNCALRDAELAMANNSYETAIPHYQRALERFALLTVPTEIDEQLAAYAAERLVVAFVQAGRMDEALAQIDQLAADDPADGTIAAALVAARQNESISAYSLCRAAFDTINALPYIPGREAGGYRRLPGYGFTDDLYESYVVSAVNDPLRGGCDITQLTDHVIAAAEFSTSAPPLEQLVNLGLQTEDAHVSTIDFNVDGTTDWVISSSYLGYRAWVFLSDGDQYRVTQSEYALPFRDEDQSRFGPELNLQMFTLPDGREQGLLVSQEFGNDSITQVCYFQNGDSDADYNIFVGYANLWRLRDGQIVNDATFYLCDTATPDVQPNGDIQAWRKERTRIEGYAVDALLPTLYRWDSASRRYVMDGVPVTAAGETPLVPTPTPLPVTSSGDSIWDLDSALNRAIFTDHDFAAAIDLADQLRALDSTYRPEQIAYLRALALEMSGRTDDALAEYVALYEADPYSAWGLLAALHFTRGES